MTRDPISEYLVADHRRLEVLLARAEGGGSALDLAAHAEFRAGLLRHIGMEEKILLPAAQRARGGEPLSEAARLRLDHGALAALLVPVPTRAILAVLRDILTGHDAIEEGPGGVYETCAQLVGPGIDALVADLHAAPAVRVNPVADGARALDAARRALRRAGYESPATAI